MPRVKSNHTNVVPHLLLDILSHQRVSNKPSTNRDRLEEYVCETELVRASQAIKKKSCSKPCPQNIPGMKSLRNVVEGVCYFCIVLHFNVGAVLPGMVLCRDMMLGLRVLQISGVHTFGWCDGSRVGVHRQ